MQLLYIADPLCSWCYGFGPELEKLLVAHPEAKLELVMGGLRPFNTDPMSDAFRDMLREHWKHVAEASGLAFSEAVFDTPGFIYDTEPPCRAVVTGRTIDASRSLALMKAIQGAFYREGQDVTKPEVLADLAAGVGYDRAEFLAALESDDMRNETRLDFTTAQSLGVTGFPTVGVAYDKQLYLVTSGFVTVDVLEERLVEIARLARERAVEKA
ncbi:hypothetical protein DSM104443_00468 [Usitatibacter rugosus]|uniref:DSBA-like thioredoxin domain-containing protein n=1 Tax=Usitatibacter rugosus TaxID=2732067 RepID=A0A6M4GSI2_9PROT|nr:DsbA family protein [Usitatibacter rugosus]QJR09424.1 hypothetical protein DSM104443_00468 [Usitatibacter rugosus]